MGVPLQDIPAWAPTLFLDACNELARLQGLPIPLADLLQSMDTLAGWVLADGLNIRQQTVMLLHLGCCCCWASTAAVDSALPQLVATAFNLVPLLLPCRRPDCLHEAGIDGRQLCLRMGEDGAVAVLVTPGTAFVTQILRG